MGFGSLSHICFAHKCVHNKKLSFAKQLLSEIPSFICNFKFSEQRKSLKFRSIFCFIFQKKWTIRDDFSRVIVFKASDIQSSFEKNGYGLPGHADIPICSKTGCVGTVPSTSSTISSSASERLDTNWGPLKFWTTFITLQYKKEWGNNLLVIIHQAPDLL